MIKKIVQTCLQFLLLTFIAISHKAFNEFIKVF